VPRWPRHRFRLTQTKEGQRHAVSSAGASSLQATLALAALSFVQRGEHGLALVRVQPVRTAPGVRIDGRYGPFRVVDTTGSR
jgi:hypothetical protein